MNRFESVIHRLRRRYIKTPIQITITRQGIMYYTIEVRKEPTTLYYGYDHTLTTLYKARKKAHEVIDQFKTPNSNYRVDWREV